MRLLLLGILTITCVIFPQNSRAASGEGSLSREDQKRLEVLAKQQLLFLDPVEQSYEELAKLDPGKYYNLERLIERGKVLLRKGEKDQGKIELHKALALLNEQLKIHKYDRHYYSFRAQVNKELGRIERAINDMKMVIELTLDDAPPMMKMGNFVRLENLRQLRGTEVDISDTLPPEDDDEESDGENAPEKANQPGKVMIGNL